MGNIEGGNNISEGNLEQQKSDIKSFLSEVAEKSSNQKLDSMIDNSDYKNLSEKQKQEKAIDAILKLGGVKYNYLKTGNALPLDVLNRMVDEIEEVNQDTQNSINAIKSSRLEVKGEISLDNNTVSSPLKLINTDKNSQGNINRANLGSEDLIKNNEGINSNIIDKQNMALKNEYKNKTLNSIKGYKQEIVYLSGELEKYKGVEGILEISRSLQDELKKLSDLEIKINNGQFDYESGKQFGKIINTLSNNEDDFFKIIGFQNSTFSDGGKSIISGDILKGLSQIGKTLMKLNKKLIDDSEEYANNYQSRIALYDNKGKKVKEQGFFFDGIGVAQTINRGSIGDRMNSHGGVENEFNHERAAKYAFLLAQEALIEAGMTNTTVNSLISTLISSSIMYGREYLQELEGKALSPGDVPIVTIIDLGDGNKLEANVTLAGSTHGQIELRHPENFIKGIDKYLKYIKLDGLNNKGTGYGSLGMKTYVKGKEMKGESSDDQIYLAQLKFANDALLNIAYNKNDSGDQEAIKANFQNFSATLSKPLYKYEGDNGITGEISGTVGYGQDKIGTGKTNSYGIVGVDAKGEIPITDNLKVTGDAGLKQYVGEGVNETGYHAKGKLDLSLPEYDVDVGLYGGINKNDLQNNGTYGTGIDVGTFVKTKSGVEISAGLKQIKSGVGANSSLPGAGMNEFFPNIGVSYEPK